MGARNNAKNWRIDYNEERPHQSVKLPVTSKPCLIDHEGKNSFIHKRRSGNHSKLKRAA